MVSLINFGQLSTVNGRRVMSGSQSGLDTAGIVEGLAAAKRLPATKYEDTIKLNNNKISALTQMKEMLKKLKTAADALRNPSGFGAGSTNAFEARTAYMSMSNGATASNYVGVTANNGTPIGKYNIKVANIAVAQSDLSQPFANLSDSVVAGDGTGGPGTGKFDAGTFNIGYTDDEGVAQNQQITLVAGSNLATVREAINAKSDITGVKATIIKYADNDYRLKLYSTETGISNGYTFTAGTGENVGFTNTPADDARIYLDGSVSPIVRSGNTIDDLIPNATMTLYQGTGAETITLDVDKDNQQIATGVDGFLSAYNEFRQFTAKQSEVDENGKLKEGAYLNNNSVMEGIRDKMASYFTGAKGAGLISPSELSSVGGVTQTHTPTSLADLGIYFTDVAASSDADNPQAAVENILNMDISKFNDNLQKYFSKSRELFEFKFSSTNSDINLYKRSNTMYEYDIASFSISVDHTQGTVSLSNIKNSKGETVGTGNATMRYDNSGTGLAITGYSGTAFEGFEMFYTGDMTGVSTSDITVKQGVGDLIFNSLASYVDGIDGNLSVIDNEIESLTRQNADAQKSVERIDDMVTSYRDQMLNKFAALEALIGASNQTLTLLDAQTNAANNG